jgi:hypothetical protein
MILNFFIFNNKTFIKKKIPKNLTKKIIKNNFYN